tara:strand:- start:56557 stop:58890 length:2334 start_codon:yes stop_codon:yes gene_type:complete
MSKRFYHLFTIFIFLLPLAVFSQTKQFQEVNYKMIDGKWHMFSDSDSRSFPIVDKTISLKFDSTISENEKANFEVEHNLIFVRKALTGWHDYKISENREVFTTAEQLLNSSLVAKLEIPTIGYYTLTPNDTDYNNQWYLNQANGINVNIENAWDTTTGNNSVTVAVLDSGTDWFHQDLGLGTDSYENIFLNPGEDAWSNPADPTTGNGIDDDGNGLIDDWKGWNFDDNYNDARQGLGGNTFFHGTHVAGIVSAKTNNNEGVAGVAGGFNNEGVKILTCAVGISGPNGAILDDAILYAAEIGARVIQLSLSVGSSSAIDDAIDMAHDVFGVVVINASGNGSSSSGVSYPASHDKVLAVGATTQTDSRANFSNHGANLFIAAPGVGIWSTQLNSQYGSSDGTSFAAPIVSGVVGLMLSVNPGLTPVEVKQILQDTAQKVGGYNYNWNGSDPGHSRELGYGRVDAFLAVQAASSGSCTINNITTTNISPCDNNGTPTDPTDDNFSVDVVVSFTDAPTTGTLDLTGDGTASVTVSGLTSPHTFIGVIMSADGGPINVTATFSDDATCTFTNTNAGTAPASCSTPPPSCTVTNITTANISPCDNNGTPTDPTDDNFSVDVIVTFANAPTTGTLDLTGDGTASIPVSGLTSPHTFTGIIMSADGGPINLTATFSDETSCTFTNTNAGTAPTSCGTLGVNDTQLSNLFTLSPNPASTRISITLNQADLSNSRITMYNLLGQKLRDITMKNVSDITVDIENLSSGLYYIKLEDNGISETQKLLIK